MLNTCQQCGKEFKAYRVQKYCDKDCFGLATRTKITKPCEYCGEDFESEPHKRRKYCTKKCTGAARRVPKLKRNCDNCGVEFSYRSCVPDTRYCTKKCGAAHKRARSVLKCKHCQTEFYPKKKTSKYCTTDCKYAAYNSNGYRSISINTVSEEEQEKFRDMFGKKGACHEHRLVMARHLDRPLVSTEIVHHKNGMKRDNRIENLELLESKKKHHTGYGDVYYQKYQESEARVKKLENKLTYLGIEV